MSKIKILVLGKSLADCLATSSFHLYRELAKQTDCVFYGKRWKELEGSVLNVGAKPEMKDVAEIVKIEKPDVIFVQWYFVKDWEYEEEGGWHNLHKSKCGVPSIVLAGDPWSRLDRKVEFIHKNCNLALLDSGLSDCPVWAGHFDKFPSMLFHAGVNTDFFCDMKRKRIYDVGIFGANNPTYYPIRNFMRQVVARQRKLKSFTPERGSGTLSTTKGYATSLNECKMTLCTGEMYMVTGTRIDLLTHKYLEGMACNAMVLGPLPVDADQLKWKDGFNIVAVDQRNFLRKLLYYKDSIDERLEIAKNGYNTIQKYHTIKIRAKQFIKTCEMLVAGEKLPKSYDEL